MTVLKMEEMSQLDRLLEKHKQLQERSAFKSSHQSSGSYAGVNSLNNHHQSVAYTNFQEKPVPAPGKVYLNPNYAPKKPVIHLNPRLQEKSPVYINPKLFIQNSAGPVIPEMMTAYSADQLNRNFVYPYTQNESHVDFDPRLMTQFIPPLFDYSCNNFYVPEDFLLPQPPIEPAITSSKQPQSNSRHNPTDLVSIPLHKLPASPVASSVQVEPNKSSILTSETTHDEGSSIDSPVESEDILDKDAVTDDIQDSNLIALSRRKLIRIQKLSKSSAASCSSKFQIPLEKEISLYGSKMPKENARNVILKVTDQSVIQKPLKSCNSPEKLQTMLVSGDENIVAKKQSKENLHAVTKMGKTTNLVSIDGVMYRSSRNQLIRSSPCIPPTKRKRTLLSSKSIRYLVTQNGKKLQKVESPIKSDCDSSSLNSSTISNKSTKSNASYKVKQKSLQILRNKTRKNNQPCLLFQRFGHCANQLRGSCSKVHDRNQVALCQKFLQGKCLANDCPLSHNVGPEKMPTCKYFLEGCCCRDACPYLHVKVPSKNPICPDFLKGYCSQGNECLNRHIRVCPEYDKCGKCCKGKSCPYPHKSPLTEKKKFEGGDQRGDKTVLTKKSPKESIAAETVKRYYEKVDEDLGEKREKLLKRIELIRDTRSAHSYSSQTRYSYLERNRATSVREVSDVQEVEIVCNKSRPLLGPLPAYIPID